MNLENWNKETRQAYVGTLFYSLFGVLAAILTPFVKVGNAVRFMSEYSGFSSSAGIGSRMLLSLVEIAIIIGYIVFYLAIKDLRKLSEGEVKKSFDKIYVSILFDILGAFFGMLHLRVLSGVMAIVACVLLLVAYSSLKLSKEIYEMSPAAASGFSLLFTAEILILVAICIGWIPLVKVIGSLLKVIAWILVLLGWKKVATSVEIPGEESMPEKPLFVSVKEVLSDSYVEAKEVAKDVVKASKIVADEVGAKAKEAGANIKERIDDSNPQSEE